MSSDKKIRLSPRLAACADYVPQGSSLVDVGTDHAYLPVWLIQNGRVRLPVTACDINAGPLDRARRSAREYGVEQSISFLLNDGLAGTSEELAETVVIAGMGGETIAGIIEASGWNWSERHSLVLQPMSKIPELCTYLYSAGFHVEKNRLVCDGGEIYRVLLARRGDRRMPPPLELYTGELDLRDPLGTEYLKKLEIKFRRAAQGLASSGRADEKTLRELRELCSAAEAAGRKMKYDVDK